MVFGSGRTCPHDFRFFVVFLSLGEAAVPENDATEVARSLSSGVATMFGDSTDSLLSSPNGGGVLISIGSNDLVEAGTAKSEG